MPALIAHPAQAILKRLEELNKAATLVVSKEGVGDLPIIAMKDVNPIISEAKRLSQLAAQMMATMAKVEAA